MSILNIIQYPDLRLRRKAYVVKDVSDPKIQKIIQDMIETLRAQKSCAALAATQLDIEDPPSITVINNLTHPQEKDIICLINPKIVSTEGCSNEDEGCMSVGPGEIYAKVKRATKIKVTALDPQGKSLEFAAINYFARCIQHECDHLAGILYIDHLSKLKRFYIDKKVAKLAKL